jgi:hypothetical protein
MVAKLVTRDVTVKRNLEEKSERSGISLKKTNQLLKVDSEPP